MFFELFINEIFEKTFVIFIFDQSLCIPVYFLSQTLFSCTGIIDSRLGVPSDEPGLGVLILPATDQLIFARFFRKRPLNS